MVLEREREHICAHNIHTDIHIHKNISKQWQYSPPKMPVDIFFTLCQTYPHHFSFFSFFLIIIIAIIFFFSLVFVMHGTETLNKYFRNTNQKLSLSMVFPHVCVRLLQHSRLYYTYILIDCVRVDLHAPRRI